MIPNTFSTPLAEESYRQSAAQCQLVIKRDEYILLNEIIG